MGRKGVFITQTCFRDVRSKWTDIIRTHLSLRWAHKSMLTIIFFGLFLLLFFVVVGVVVVVFVVVVFNGASHLSLGM